VRATVARFWQMLQDAPRTMPYQMPMTPAVAPAFAARYPEAAIIFDNLHSMHDVVSDILANDSVPRARKRAEIMRAARLYRDDTSYVMPVPAYLTMAREMGVENMGGPAVGFVPQLPTPTVTYGAVMEHDEQTGRMVGMKYGQHTGAHGGAHGAEHTAAAGGGGGAKDSAADEHAAHAAPAAPAAPAATAADSAPTTHDGHDMRAMHQRMMADPVIRRRVMADTALRRMMAETMEIEGIAGDTAAPPTPAAASRAAGTTTRPRSGTPARRATGAAPKSRTATGARPAADPHAGHGTAAPSPARPQQQKPRPAAKRDSAPPAVDHSKHGAPKKP
jgi:hypothetical protein